MTKEIWRYIDSREQSPAFNMALDEALLDWHSAGKIPPTIRFYGWNPPTLSVGYFQKVDKEVNMDRVRELGLGFVRRPTGGRGVLHDKELTYSVIVSEDHPEMPRSVTEAYRVISEGILEGFKALGLDAYFAIPRTEEEKEGLKNPRSAVCFDAPSWYELVVEGGQGNVQRGQQNGHQQSRESQDPRQRCHGWGQVVVVGALQHDADRNRQDQSCGRTVGQSAGSRFSDRRRCSQG